MKTARFIKRDRTGINRVISLRRNTSMADYPYFEGIINGSWASSHLKRSAI